MFLDIGLGIFIAIGANIFFQLPLSVGLVLFVIVSALLPDIDVLLGLFCGKKNPMSHATGPEIFGHRMITHYPIIYIPIAILIFLFFGAAYGIIFSVAILAHLLHDSVGIGWGVKWLWPLSQKNFKFFTDKQNETSWNFLVSWTPAELQDAMAHYGKPDWFKQYYLQLSLINVIEFSVFLAACILLFVMY